MLFLVRWILTTLGLWVSVKWFGKVGGDGGIWPYLLAGVIFSVVNMIVKPIITLFSLPVILLTMGLFTLVVNGIMVWLTVLMVPGLEIGFWWAVLAGIVMAVVNYIVNMVQQSYNKRHERR